MKCPWFWAAIVLAAGFLLRLGLWLVYSPVAYGDTPAYRRLADQIRQSWDMYDGTRTPGYPVFLLVVGPDERVWLVQMGLGLLTALLLFYIAWQVSGRAWVGGLVGIAHSANLGQIFFEANLLGETLTTFLVVLALAGVIAWLHRPPLRSLWLAAAVGVAASLATLVRPLFIFLPFWLALFMMLRMKETPEREGRRRFSLPKVSISVKYAAAALIPAGLIVGGWVSFIHHQYGDWSMTTMTGYHLIQHTGVFFEYVPDEYADLRDTYLEYRAVQIAERGSQANTIWVAIPAMQKASGRTFYDLSRLLARISVRLILEHPELYLKNVIKGWWYFWRVPVYWKAEAFKVDGLASIMPGLILAQRLALIGANLIFLVSSAGAAVWGGLRGRLRVPAGLWCLAGAVWGASVLQTLVDHGDNPRFLVPLQSLVVIWVIWLGVQAYGMARESSARKLAVETR